VAEQLGVLAEHVRRYGGLSLQMDAMLHQYRAMNEAMAGLAAATQQLQQAVAALSSTRQGQQAREQQGQERGRGVALWGEGQVPAGVAAAGAACLVVGVVAGWAAGRRR
jgi:hypothetical protein